MTALELAAAIGQTEDRFAKNVFSPPAVKKRSRPIRTALILAAVLALLTLLLGVAARELGFLERMFPGEKFENLEDYVNHMDVSVENDSLRLTLHEAVTDGYNTYLVFSVELLNGDSMDRWEGADYIIQPMTTEGFPVVRGGGSGGNLGTGTDRGLGKPNRIVYYWHNQCQMNTGRISVRLFGLKNLTTGESFSPGYLEAEAELKPCLTKISRQAGKETEEDAYANIVLSPFGLRADAAGVDVEKLGAGKVFRGKLEYVFREGGEAQKISSTQALRPDPVQPETAVLSVAFRQPTDIREIVAVRIDGVEYPLGTGPLPKREPEKAKEAEIPELSAETRQALYDELFSDCTPVESDHTADNGVYRLESRDLALWGDEDELHLRLWLTAAALEGEYDRILALWERIGTCLLIDGKEVIVFRSDGRVNDYFDSETGERVYLLKMDFTGEGAKNALFDGDFTKASALRLIWTPPAGDRIALDLELRG